MTDPGDASGSKRRRRRARRDAREAVVEHNGGNGGEAGDQLADSSVVAVAVPAPEPAAEPATEAAIEPAAEAVTEPATEAITEPATEPAVEPAPAVTVLVAPVPPAPDEFRDLLGQAVGLRLDAVSREFGGRNEMHVTALHNVTLDIGPCEYVAIVGPSGCGKSTLLSLMGGLDRPTAGHVYGAGLPLGELPDRDLADYRLQRVSTIFQTFNLIATMTVEDNVALPLTLAGVELEERRKRARHLLAMVGLEHRAGQRASRLSGGEQQKVAVARALANRPGLILADEPTGSLDSTAGESVLNLLHELNQRGATIVLVTHDPEVARHAKRVVRMIDGRAVEVEAGRPTVRSQEPVDVAPRMHWKDTLKVGLGSAGRRPLRTVLTTTGVAIGIAALSLIVALAAGLQQALDAPALATSQIHQVAVYPVSDAANTGFDSPTLATLARLPHVRASWGQIGLSGTFGASGSALSGSAPGATSPGQLVSLPLKGWSSAVPTLSAGRLPSSDAAPEVLLTDTEVTALGFQSPAAALGTEVAFNATAGGLVPSATNNKVTKPVALNLVVVGIMSTNFMPAGAPGGLVPNGTLRNYWTNLAQANKWKGGEYTSITLLADSGLSVEGLQQRVTELGFQSQTFGDQFRNFEDLLGKLKVALLGLAIVALLLACLGIANTMYTAVLERTKEIGVLKALGGRSRDVLLLFLAEAAGIGIAGGLIGTIVAVGLGRLGNAAVDRLTASVTASSFDVFRIDVVVLLVAVILAALLSTVSGLLPALRAARQEPSRALRYE